MRTGSHGRREKVAFYVDAIQGSGYGLSMIMKTKQQKQQKTWYAINYPAGQAVNANTGLRYGTYRAFPSSTARDEWVNSGGDFRTSSNWREKILASDLEIRAIRREEERNPEPWSVIENAATA